MVLENNNEISVEKFVDRLFKEGCKVRCDDTNEEFDRNNKVPPFYDEKLFKIGQKFFHKHIFSMFVCKFVGLVAVLAIPSILKILISTGMSGSDFTAYKRYMATLLHIMVWYDEDFKPGSRSWKSLSAVRNMHNSASKKCTKVNIGSITQKDMALTQFGFMGFVITRGDKLGIYDPTDEELEGFIHLWRVVGYLMGIEDRFNICSGSVEETKEICELLVARAFKPEIEKKNEDFLTMSRYLCNGMSLMDVLITHEAVMCALNLLIQENLAIEKLLVSTPQYLKLSSMQIFSMNIGNYMLYAMRFTVVRLFLNYIKIFQLWTIKKFPIVAFYKFGFKDTIVDIKV